MISLSPSRTLKSLLTCALITFGALSHAQQVKRLVITNTGSISTISSDALRLNKANSSLVLNNNGTIKVTGTGTSVASHFFLVLVSVATMSSGRCVGKSLSEWTARSMRPSTISCAKFRWRRACIATAASKHGR